MVEPGHSTARRDRVFFRLAQVGAVTMLRRRIAHKRIAGGPGCVKAEANGTARRTSVAQVILVEARDARSAKPRVRWAFASSRPRNWYK